MAKDLIYITGADGVGKSTLARLLLDKLDELGLHYRHLWLRFPFFFSYPFLLYSRIRGYSWYEEHDDQKHGYWDFSQSFIMTIIFPWIYLVDAWLASLIRVQIPILLGRAILCERFVLDMLVDLVVALNDLDLIHSPPGSLFFRLLPSNALVFVLDADIQTIYARRPDLRTDKRLESRLEVYRKLSGIGSFHQVSSENPVELNTISIVDELTLE
jgi:hypothetical protein